ncbi:MAG: hypothetical protein ACON5N_07950 [Akkermansiaceae bacterium]
MKTILRYVAALVVGVAIGMLVNISLVNLGPRIIPLPEGADVSTMEGLKESIKLYQPAHFLFPFLGHAVGTLVGAFLVALLAGSHAMRFALAVGCFFLFGGISMVVMVGGPLWFILADLILAYLPMGYLGGVSAAAVQRALKA